MNESGACHKPTRVAIIGSGPRGLSVLERIVHHGQQNPDDRWDLLLFDKHELGPGCHVSDQSRHLLLNTAADQTTIFPKPSEPATSPARHTMTFDQWILDCLEKGRHHDLIVLNNDSPVDSYQPRALFGHYLMDMLSSILAVKSAGTEVQLINAYVHDLSREDDGTWTLQVDNQTYRGVDYVYLCTGHNINLEVAHPGQDGFIGNPFPIQQTMALIPDQSVVALQGLGLTAIDVIAELTQGRGGRFVSDQAGKIRYEPSGREPLLLAYSRTGIPLRSRPVNEKTSIEQRRGKHFTRDAIDRHKQSGKVDFAACLLPLILKDMEDAGHAALTRNASGPERDEAGPEVRPASEQPPFTWETLARTAPPESLATPETFRAYVLDFLTRDMEESTKGNVRSPLKAAYDVLRDHRELMAHAIDFEGLEGTSQTWFYNEFLPVIKRLSVGPPKERIAQLIALVEAGILKMDFGPGARCEKAGQGWQIIAGPWPDYRARADFLIDARLPVNGPGNDPLIRRLVEKGIARYFQNGDYVSDGLEIDRCLQVIDQGGHPVPSLWALGVVTEGTRFYTFFLPRPYGRSRFEDDAETAVASMMEQVTTLAVPAG